MARVVPLRKQAGGAVLCRLLAVSASGRRLSALSQLSPDFGGNPSPVRATRRRAGGGAHDLSQVARRAGADRGDRGLDQCRQLRAPLGCPRLVP